MLLTGFIPGTGLVRFFKRLDRGVDLLFEVDFIGDRSVRIGGHGRHLPVVAGERLRVFFRSGSGKRDRPVIAGLRCTVVVVMPGVCSVLLGSPLFFARLRFGCIRRKITLRGF
ncbi:MAG: hypothetical protein P8X53_10485 [Chromatiales bacterium]